MFIEVLHDSEGNISACYCSDTLPVADGSPITVYSQVPEGCVQARINIDTLTAMEIEAGCGHRVSLDPVTKKPVIVNVQRPEHIMENFMVDTSSEFIAPSTVNMPAGMKMRGFVRKD
ncbi:MAG: hypothetical protein HY889_08890 [Deltaproteobacteria bacterium]|nr:hypothetical protein [Deltaproteobacteria bacterium]